MGTCALRASLAAFIETARNANTLLHSGTCGRYLRGDCARSKRKGWIKDKHERELIKALEHHIQWATRSAPRPGP